MKLVSITTLLAAAIVVATATDVSSEAADSEAPSHGGKGKGNIKDFFVNLFLKFNDGLGIRKQARRRLKTWRCYDPAALHVSGKVMDGVTVDCFGQDAAITKEDIPLKCHNEMYDVSLATVAGGPHFFLIGMKKDVTENGCPPSIVMDQVWDQKKIAMMFLEDAASLSMFPLGEASLTDILEAEEGAEAYDVESYDYFYNSCGHYAQRIWRALEFEETTGLVNFFVDNIVDDEQFIEHAKKSKGGLALSALVAVGGKGLFKGHIEDILFPLLDSIIV